MPVKPPKYPEGIANVESPPLDASRREKPPGISRREMVQKLMSGASGGLMISGMAAPPALEGQPIEPTAAAETDAKTPQQAAAPRFLDPHQNETLIVLAECIVPGSTQADVSRFVDLLLSVDTEENQAKFVASLSAMDGESLRRYAAPFKNLSQARRIELLTDASTAPLRPSPAEAGDRSSSASAAGTGLPLSGLRDHFENLKAWIVKAYYSSEAGMKELGWKDQYFYETFSE